MYIYIYIYIYRYIYNIYIYIYIYIYILSGYPAPGGPEEGAGWEEETFAFYALSGLCFQEGALISGLYVPLFRQLLKQEDILWS